MKKNLKFFAKFLPIFALTFISIYLLVFFGGYKLFEAKNPILMEIGVSILVSIVFYVIECLNEETNNRIEKLENRITELESLLRSKE